MSNQKIGNLDIALVGRFMLKVNRDPKKFSLTNINSFVPVGKQVKDRVMFMTESGLTDTLFIDRVTMLFDPNNQVHLHNIQAFIQHPNVMIGGYSEDQHQKLVELGLKNGKCDFIITNVDKVEDEAFDNEIDIIRVRGMIFSDDKKLSFEKLVWLCSQFNISYVSSRHITDKARKKKDLQKRLDSYVTTSAANALKVKEALEDLEKTEFNFYINELINMGIIVDYAGIYKIGDTPVGGAREHIYDFYKQDQALYIEHQKLVKEALKEVLQ